MADAVGGSWAAPTGSCVCAIEGLAPTPDISPAFGAWSCRLAKSNAGSAFCASR